MSAGGARRGRRDNGLHAADYAVAGDVDPRVGEHLLDVLAVCGIAAYLQPSSDLNPILRTTTLPARPTDRLYVDRAHLAVAREHLERLSDTAAPARDAAADPERTGVDQHAIDAAWAQIVADFHTTVDPASAPWPAAETLDPAPSSDPDRDGSGSAPSGQLTSATDISGISLNRRRTDDPSRVDGLDIFGAELDDGERYIPPPPPPLPRISKVTLAAMLGILLGFTLFLFPLLVPIISETTATLIGFAAVVGGAVTLVWRLRSGDDEDDFDDGAVV